MDKCKLVIEKYKLYVYAPHERDWVWVYSENKKSPYSADSPAEIKQVNYCKHFQVECDGVDKDREQCPLWVKQQDGNLTQKTSTQMFPIFLPI